MSSAEHLSEAEFLNYINQQLDLKQIILCIRAAQYDLKLYCEKEIMIMNNVMHYDVFID